MTDDETVALFLKAQNLLTIADNRVQLNPLTYSDLNTITALCFAVEAAATAALATPADLALRRLACATGAVITTSVVDQPRQP